jgi:hypothetical protein
MTGQKLSLSQRSADSDKTGALGRIQDMREFGVAGHRSQVDHFRHTKA